MQSTRKKKSISERTHCTLRSKGHLFVLIDGPCPESTVDLARSGSRILSSRCGCKPARVPPTYQFSGTRLVFSGTRPRLVQYQVLYYLARCTLHAGGCLRSTSSVSPWNPLVGIPIGIHSPHSARLGHPWRFNETEGALGGKILTQPLTLEHCTVLAEGADTESGLV